MRAWGTGTAGSKAPASPPRRKAEEEDDEVGGRRRSRSRAGRGWSRGRDLPAARRERQAYGSFGANGGGKGRGKSLGDDWYGGKGAWGKGGFDWLAEDSWGRKGARKGGSKGKGLRSAVEQDSKLAERARRFAGLRSEPIASVSTTEEDSKKVDRAKRFGMRVPATAKPESKAAKTDTPKEIAEPAKPADPEAVEKEESKKKDRAARFGLPVAITKAAPVEPAAAAPAVVSAEEAEVAQKMAERAKRFGLATPQGATDKQPAAEKAMSTPAAAEAGKEEAKDAAAEEKAKTAAS